MEKRRASRAPVDPKTIISDEILSSITDALCAFDREWNFVFANDSCVKLVGKKRDELLGKNLWEVFPASEGSEIRERLTTALRDGEAVHFETRHEGIGAWVSIHAYPSEEGISVFVRDVTAEKEIRDRLRASEERFRALVEKSWDGLALVDAESRFLYVSPSVTRILGYTPEELVGRCSADFVAGDPAERKRVFDDLVSQPGNSTTGELAYVAKNGEVRWLETVRTNLLEEPAVRAIVANFRDVTERRRVSEALTRAVHARDEMLAVVSHDLRNPLNAMSLVTQILFQPDLPPDEVAKQLVTLKRLTLQMSDLIRDLLDVALLDSGGVRIERSREDFGALAADALEALAPLAVERGIQVKTEGFDRVGDVVGERKRLQQVIANLVSNAIKFTPPDGEIVVRAMSVGDEVRVSVTDNGQGIAAEDLGRVFDRYWHGRQGDVGNGLGLAIAKGLVEAHGGRIWVESERGKGTTVTFTLPRAPLRLRDATGGSSTSTVH